MRRLLARPRTEDEVMRLRQMAEAGMKTSLIARKLVIRNASSSH
jgi:hypothetical protein